MDAVSHPPTSSELLDHALAHQAPHLVKVLELALQADGEVVVDDLLVQLAAAIDRRVYVAIKRHDEHIAGVLDDAASRIRARYTVERETLERLDEACAGDEDPTPQRDHSAAELAVAAIDADLTEAMRRDAAAWTSHG